MQTIFLSNYLGDKLFQNATIQIFFFENPSVLTACCNVCRRMEELSI